MGSLTVAGIVFVCTFGSGLLGFYLHGVLPKSHLTSDSKDVIKLGTGLVATLSALVLGLLIASAKNTIDARRIGFQQLSTNVVLLDRLLKFYGPETQPIRQRLQRTVELVLEHQWPRKGSPVMSINTPDISDGAGAIYIAIGELLPQTNSQRSIQSQALQIGAELARTRWILSHGDESSIPTPFLVVLILWLSALFVFFGLFSPPNLTVTTALLICALSLAAAIFLIVEMDHPHNGLIQISDKPLRDAVSQICR